MYRTERRGNLEDLRQKYNLQVVIAYSFIQKLVYDLTYNGF